MNEAILWMMKARKTSEFDQLQDSINLRLEQIRMEFRSKMHTLARATGQYLKVKPQSNVVFTSKMPAPQE